MKTHVKVTQLIAVAVMVFGSVMTLKAQTITGSVNGTVTDPSGAILPKAKVTATNVDTGVTTTATTNSDGIYNIQFLQIGRYKVAIESPGFAVSTFGPFVLETGQNAKIDAKLGMSSHSRRCPLRRRLLLS
jgi:hypothetical protein